MIGPSAFGAGRDESRDYGAYIRECVNAEYFTNLPEPFDASEDAARLTMPVLLIRHVGLAYVTMDMTKDLASRIDGAQLTVVPGGWADDPVGLADRVSEFVNAGSAGERHRETAATAAKAAPVSGTAVIMFTDIANSTAITERLGDTLFRDASRALDDGLRAAIRGAGGSAIDGKLLGDGVLATFPSAAQAIDGARRCLALSAASELGLHIGLHAGDVIREENNVFGGAVNIASRICGLSAPGEILVSDVVRGMARSSAGAAFEDRGEQEMKGVGEPVRVYAVRWRE
jgi:class 3 adenylate cyclase